MPSPKNVARMPADERADAADRDADRGDRAEVDLRRLGRLAAGFVADRPCADRLGGLRQMRVGLGVGLRGALGELAPRSGATSFLYGDQNASRTLIGLATIFVIVASQSLPLRS